MSYVKGTEEVTVPETGITGKKKRKSCRLCTVAVAIVVLILAAISIAGIYFMVKYAQESSTEPSLALPQSYPTSCLELRTNGTNTSSYYIIQPVAASAPFMTYCDMETDGGGWTLVASIHEANIDKKCAEDDVWFSNGSAATSETRLWENSKTLNSADSSTVRDYKNAGYATMEASDLMVRHVPNGVAVSESKKEATLEYFSRNKFLTSYGGNLRSLYANHFPLTPSKDSEDVLGPSVVEEMLDSLAKASDAGSILNITSPPPMYMYVYDDVAKDRLTNGGNNLFDPFGMQVSARSSDCGPVVLEYGRTYACPDMGSRKSYPFFALMRTGNVTIPHSYRYNVTSHRSNADDQPTDGHISYSVVGQLLMDYFYSCKYSDSVPSYCDIWFTVYSPWLWRSERVTVDSLSFPHSSASHSNAVYGYTMISRQPPSLTDHQFPYTSFMMRVLEVLAKFKTRDIQGMLDALQAQGASLLDTAVPAYYQYVYDNISPSRLTNGGNDLFSPYGMEIKLETKATTPTPSKTLEYGKSYLLPDQLIQLSSRKSHPFFALAKNEKLDQVIGFSFTQGRSKFDRFISQFCKEQNSNIRHFQMRCEAFCRYSNTAPSICNIVFEVYNRRDWGSRYISYFQPSLRRTWERNISGIPHYFIEKAMIGRYTNSIVGYTLLAREPGSIYIPFRVDEILHNILRVIAQFPTIASSCTNSSANLIVPIQHSIGNVRTVLTSIPRNFIQYSTPGRMQFRATGYSGNVYAFCPAVSVESCQSEFVCVGGVKKDPGPSDDCSDFLDWGVAESRNSSDVSSATRGNKHPGNDIESTIMMFYR